MNSNLAKFTPYALALYRSGLYVFITRHGEIL